MSEWLATIQWVWEGELRGNCETKFVTLICLLVGFMIFIREYKRLLKQYKKQLSKHCIDKYVKSSFLKTSQHGTHIII